VSGATNTATITASSVSYQNLFNSINNYSLKLLSDNKEITIFGEYYGNEFKFMEKYNVIDYKSMIDYLQANIGSYHDDDNIGGVVELSNVYEIKKGDDVVVTSTFRVLVNVDIDECGFIQTYPPNAPGYTQYRYVPDVVSKSGWDFKNLVDISSYASNINYYLADFINASIPPNRIISWLIDTLTSEKYVGYAIGYTIDKSNSKNTDRLAKTTKFLDLRDTTKIYPAVIGDLNLDAGDYFTVIGYRNYFSPLNQPNVTNAYTVKSGNDVYVFIDAHQTLSFDNFELKDQIGKNITVVLKHDDFTLHNDIVGETGIVFSIANSYGYAILKLS
jgi:hypothetical protein